MVTCEGYSRLVSQQGNHADRTSSKSTPPALRIVVTGGIGAGKSTVSSLLEARGAVVVEADRIGHRVLEPGHPVADVVAERWPAVVGVGGAIDRSRLAAVVFSDETALRELESFTHPAIAQEIARRAQEAGDVPVVVEVPVLAPWFDEAWWWITVTADPEIRLERAEGRGSDRADAERRMANQAPEADYVAAADFVVVNDGGLADLERRVDEIWDELHAE